MMYEYFLLVFSMLLRIAISEDHAPCTFYKKREGELRGIYFDLNRWRGVQSLDLDNDTPSQNSSLSNTRDSLTLMISLCDQLQTSPMCDTSASACIFSRDGRVYQENAGSSIFFRDGSTAFLFFDLVGSACKNDSLRPFIIHFRFSCKLKPFQLKSNRGYGVFAAWQGKSHCEVSVNWMLEDVCGVPEELNYTCGINVGNQIVDLTSLKSKTFWSVTDTTGSGKNYEFNICEPIKGGSCKDPSVFLCEIDNYSNTTSVVGTAMYPYYNRGVGITIDFAEGDYLPHVLLQCVPESPDFKPKLKIKYSTPRLRPILVFETPLACDVPPAFCLAVDPRNGRQYNLYTLVGEILEINYESSKIIISICGPLYKEYDKNIPCSGPGFSVCQIQDKKVVRVLGMIGNKPELTRNGSIRIVYPSGSPCPYSSNNGRYTTYVDLYCDVKTGESEVDEMGCDIFIKYSTPIVCLTKEVFGKDCKVTDPLFNFTIDLNVLRNETADIIIPVEKNKRPAYRFNLCGPLIKPCNGITNTSLCFYKRNGVDEDPFGPPALYPKLHDSMVQFDLYGPPCQLQQDYTRVTFLLVCDHSATEVTSSTLQYVPTLSGRGCHTYVIWKTYAACPPFSEHRQCIAKNEKTGELYDLSKLSDPEKNYRIVMQLGKTMNNDVSYILNVCRSVIYGPSSACPPYSGVCLNRQISKGSQTVETYINLGKVGKAGPSIDDDGKLVIHLTDGDNCLLDKKLKYSSTIIFICSEGNTDSDPQYIQNKSTTCHYQFQWKTMYACPVSKNNETSGIQVEQQCFAVSEITKQSFNLKSLESRTWVIRAPPPSGSKSLIFYISICKVLPRHGPTAKCPPNAGVCMEKDDKYSTLGAVSGDLHHNGHQWFLTYENGDICSGKELFQTEVSFVCSNEYFPKTGPQYIGSVGCKHMFVFYTDLACGKDSQSCTVDTTIFGEEVNLSLKSLMRSTTPYRVESSDGYKFLLNICGPIPRGKRLGCKDGSSVCMLNQHFRATIDSPMEKPMSLGFPTSRPVLDHLPGVKNPQVVWKSTGDERCLFPSKSNASASIRFICDPNVGPGRPIYQGNNGASRECVYHFSWNTSVVCLDDKIEFDRQNCILRNHGTQEVFNLTELYPERMRKDMMRGLKPQMTGENLYVYLCPWSQVWMDETNTMECKDTAVCANVGDGTGFIGYGYQHYAYYDSSNNTIKLFFRGTYRYTCSDREVSGAEIWFPCAADGKSHKPKLLAATECHVVIEWPTPLMCPRTVEESSAMRTAWRTMATLMAVALFGSAILYVVRKTNCWPSVRSHVNRAMGYNHSSLVTYTAEPQEEWTECDTLNE